MSLINLENKISEIIEDYPETLSIFSLYGFDADTKERLIESVGEDSMLKTVLSVKQINPKLFINSLNETIADMKLYNDFGNKEISTDTTLNLLAYIPCTMKQYFKENLDIVLDVYKNETGISLHCDIPMGCGSKDEYESLWEKENIDELPDIIISMGFGDFFRKKFIDNFVNKGYFEAILPSVLNKDFVNSGLIDPDNNYAIYSLHPYIFLIDKEKLGDLPVPEKWDDLLDPVYKNNISIGGHGDEISEAILIHFIKEYGNAAVERLAENIKNIWHGSEMAKHAGSNSEEGTAIYIISHFFATSCPRKDKIKMIFPSDGIAASHLYMLVKKDAKERVKPITDYVYSDMIGDYFASQSFPVINGNITDPIYAGKKIKWIGWDYIYQNNIFEKRSEAIAYFLSLWKNRSLEKTNI